MPASTLTAESGSRLERKRARNREALIAAARRLFVRDGFEKTTIAAIAAEADLGFGTFYRYFPDKESALRAVLAEADREMQAVVVADGEASISAGEALTDLTARFVQAAGRHRRLFALWWSLSMRGGTKAKFLPEGEKAMPVTLRAALERIIARGIAAGEFLPGDASLLASIVAGAHMSLLVQMQGMSGNEEHIVKTLTDFELRALGFTVTSAGDDNGRSGR
jgi:AcrR family transcriptional regulator